MEVAAFTLVWIGLALYALLAGADFGVGLWVLVSSFTRRGKEIRGAALGYFGPVWEVNGLFLVFFIVGLMAGFPKTLSVLSLALIPLVLAALVMFVLRSAAYALLHHGPERYHGPSRAVFGVTSVLAGLGLGYAAVAPASGLIRGDDLDAAYYTSTVALAALPLTLAGSAHLSATVVAAYADARERAAVDWYRVAALVSGAVMLPLTAVFTVALADQNPYLRDQLLTPRIIPMVLGGILIFGGTVALFLRRYAPAALLTFAGYFAGLMGGAFVQYPYMVYPDLTIAEAAAPDASLVGYLIVTAVGGPLLIAALLALYHTTLGPQRGDTSGSVEVQQADAPAPAVRG